MFQEISQFLARFDVADLSVISINILLMIFASRIMRIIYHGADNDKRFLLKVRIFRAFNLAIIAAFIYYHMVLPVSEKGPGMQVLASIVVLYLSYVFIHGLNTFVHSRYGKQKILDDKAVIIETYNSRLISIISTLLVSVVVVVAVVRILGFESWLEAGGVLGVMGVFLALTQNVWAPDLFSGLIMLNSGMLETGDVIEFQAEERDLGVVYKTRLFHTELLNLVNNHRLMVRNATLRDLIIHNLSKFASARGLREKLCFNIGYDVPVEKVQKMFARAFAQAMDDSDVAVEAQHGVEVRTLEAGDYAVAYGCFFYTKDVRHILRTRYKLIEYILRQAAQENIALWTPMLQQVELHNTQDSRPPP